MTMATLRDYIAAEIEVLKALDFSALERTASALLEAREREAEIFVFGNGGSAANASHWANDFNQGLARPGQKAFRFTCLSDNLATVLAVANDLGYEHIFSFQLAGRLKPGDVVLALSGSGNSPNVVQAAELAQRRGNLVIGLTGYDGGRLKELSDISLHVPVRNMQIAEDVHLIINHALMSFIRAQDHGREGRA